MQRWWPQVDDWNGERLLRALGEFKADIDYDHNMDVNAD